MEEVFEISQRPVLRRDNEPNLLLCVSRLSRRFCYHYISKLMSEGVINLTCRVQRPRRLLGRVSNIRAACSRL